MTMEKFIEKSFHYPDETSSNASTIKDEVLKYYTQRRKDRKFIVEEFVDYSNPG